MSTSKIIFFADSSSNAAPVDPPLPPMKRRDFTLEELKPFDGHGPVGRVLIGVLGKVYDVRKGKSFYGPGTLWRHEILVQ